MKIYWSGAALALLADAELRRRSDGQQSLDTVLGDFEHCCLPARSSWSSRRFFERLDATLDEPLFMPLYQRYADRPGFPDFEDALADRDMIAAIFAPPEDRRRANTN